MKRKEGFTLIELLVVMAIIAILGAIVVPNVVGWIGRARMTRAQSEIESIETALAKMLTDASRNNLNDLLKPGDLNAPAGRGVWVVLDELVGDFPDDNGPAMDAAHFKMAQQIYTNTFYALLRNGRDILKNETTDPALGFQYADVLRPEVVKLLGTSYLDISYDPWGNLYQIFPAPWGRGSVSSVAGESRLNPMIFRTFLRVEQDSNPLPGVRDQVAADAFSTTNTDNETIGFPAPLSPGVAFIHSFGANLISGQLQYVNRRLDGGTLTYPTQEQDWMGGGDDINNWDPETTWNRFYS